VKKEIKKYLESNAERLETLKSPLIYSQRTGGHFSSQTLQILFKTLYSNVGINASSHSGRRKFITDLSEKGVSVRVIQELARHRDLATTQRYDEDMKSEKGSSNRAANALALSTEGWTCPFSMR